MSVQEGRGRHKLQAPSFAGEGSRERRWPVRVIGQADRERRMERWILASATAASCRGMITC